MKTTCYIKTTMDMDEVMEISPVAILKQELSKYGLRGIDESTQNDVLEIMRKQVSARFLYDYRAILDYDSGSLAFMVSYDEYNSHAPWILKARKGHVGGIHHSDDGKSIESITEECESICKDYIRIALSYSAAGVASHVKKN